MIENPKSGQKVWSIATEITGKVSGPLTPYEATVRSVARRPGTGKRATIEPLNKADWDYKDTTAYTTELFESEFEAWKGYAAVMEDRANELRGEADELLEEHRRAVQAVEVARQKAQELL